MSASANAGRALFAIVAWRNLWRNPRRTWLTAGGIAFATALVVFSSSIQVGSYDGMIDMATRLVSSHIQVQHPKFQDDPRMRYSLPEGVELTERLARLPGVAGAAPRAEAFALLSTEERSFGGLVLGVDPDRERQVSDLPNTLVEGEYLPGPDDAFIGAALARNLDISLADEILVLGTGKEGSVGALALRVGGIFETGHNGTDRSLILVRLQTLQEGFELGDEVHRVLVAADSISDIDDVARRIELELGADFSTLKWNALMPEIEQGIQIDWVSSQLMYWLLLILVAFAIVNTFMMTVFERTREFGMLLAIGMRPASIMGMLQVEAIAMWVDWRGHWPCHCARPDRLAEPNGHRVQRNSGGHGGDDSQLFHAGADVSRVRIPIHRHGPRRVGCRYPGGRFRYIAEVAQDSARRCAADRGLVLRQAKIYGYLRVFLAPHSFLARGIPSRSPAEVCFHARGAPSRSPAEVCFLARGAPSRSPAEGSVAPPCVGPAAPRRRALPGTKNSSQLHSHFWT